MNHSPNGNFHDPECGNLLDQVDETLHVIATLPAPEGLVDRVQEGLRHAPRPGRVLLWHAPVKPAGGWISSQMARGAAAAAIVCVVAGGGWQIYTHASLAPAAKVIAMPRGPGATGQGFSPAGAMRVPGTLEGPVLKHPLPATSRINVVNKTPVTPALKKKRAPRRPPEFPAQ